MCKPVKIYMHDAVRISEAENMLASVSSYEFVDLLRPVMRSLSSSKTESNVETYIDLVNDAVKMLYIGKSQNDVLSYFDNMAYN